MQTEFKFLFHTYDFLFEKELKFNGSIGESNSPISQKGALEGLNFFARIIPENNNNNHKSTQSGALFVKVPFNKEHAEEIILELVHLITQKINFNNAGKFEVLAGMYTGERIPETDEEKAYVGDKPCFAHMSLIEDIGDPIFDKKQFFDQTSNASTDLTLIQQHNHASQAKHPIDKFVSYYKIIEDLLFCKKRTTAKELLRNNILLREAYQSAFDELQSDEDYLNFVESIVDIRHKCSHLKRSNNFGYIINDSRIESEVETQLGIMHYITYQLIIENGKNV